MSTFQWLAFGMALVAALVLGLWLASLVFRRREVRRKAGMLDAAARGRALEGEAPAALARAGYRVLEGQVDRRYTFTVDGAEHQAALRADFLVERGGQHFVVEVKTGEAARPTRRETRRQLLEYCLHYPVQGVLLFDPERGELRAVAFPTTRPEAPRLEATTSRASDLAETAPSPAQVRRGGGLFLLAFFAGALAASALWWTMH